MIRTATLLVTLVLAAPVAAQQPAGMDAGPALKREATITGELVRIGDLIENAGVVAEVPIFRAPISARPAACRWPRARCRAPASHHPARDGRSRRGRR